MGVKFGRAIASVLVMVTKFIAKLVECGIKIPIMIAKGILSGVGKVTEAIKKVTQSIRDHLPHSPAKTGPLKDLHRVKIIETVATSIKETPLKQRVSRILNSTLELFNSKYNVFKNFLHPNTIQPIKHILEFSTQNPVKNLVSQNVINNQFYQNNKQPKIQLLKEHIVQKTMVTTRENILTKSVGTFNTSLFKNLPEVFANSMKNLVKIAKSNITYNITKSNSVKNKSLQNQVKKNVLNSTPSLNIEYKPSIAINYSGEAKPTQIKQDFEYLIKKHKNEILNLVRKEQERLYRLAY